MHVLLTRAVVPPPTLEYAKIAAVKIEDNIEQWIDLWVVVGQEVAGEFVEYLDPETGQQISPIEIHLETGQHPLADRGTSLRKCPDCARWYQLEVECEDCHVPTNPYDGFIRCAQIDADRPASAALSFWRSLYRFVLTEEVPDPITGVVRKLVDATLV